MLPNRNYLLLLLCLMLLLSSLLLGYNPDVAPVDVGGWQFTRGVDYIIPAPRVIPAGGWLVVAANVAAFQTAHPGFGGTVIGGWTGQLSNSGETVTLRDALSAEVDTVDYADEGDWAVRGRGPVVANWAGHQGWDWFTNADALGRTKELVRTTLRKNSGLPMQHKPRPCLNFHMGRSLSGAGRDGI